MAWPGLPSENTGWALRLGWGPWQTETWTVRTHRSDGHGAGADPQGDCVGHLLPRKRLVRLARPGGAERRCCWVEAGTGIRGASRAGGWGAEDPGPGIEPASLKDIGFGAKDPTSPLLSEAPRGVHRPPEAGWWESLRFIVIIPSHGQFSSSPQSCYSQWPGDLMQPIGPQSLSCTTLRAPEPHTDAHTRAPP